jgi:hypothetical protein
MNLREIRWGDIEQWQSLVNMAMNFFDFQKRWGIS